MTSCYKSLQEKAFNVRRPWVGADPFEGGIVSGDLLNCILTVNTSSFSERHGNGVGDTGRTGDRTTE